LGITLRASDRVIPKAQFAIDHGITELSFLIIIMDREMGMILERPQLIKELEEVSDLASRDP